MRRQSVLAVRAALILLAALAMLAARAPASAQTLGSDATLSGLTLSAGRLSPAFAGGTTAYTASSVPASGVTVHHPDHLLAGGLQQHLLA